MDLFSITGSNTFAANMLTRIISILLIFVLLSTSFTRLVFYAGYEMNKAYIAKVLCINKAKPMMHCNGKCFLSKKIKEAEEKEQKQGSAYSKSNLEVFITSHFNFRCFTFQTDEYLMQPLSDYFFSTVYKIFQPPQF